MTSTPRNDLDPATPAVHSTWRQVDVYSFGVVMWELVARSGTF